jgi:hypothetical protein
VVDRPEVDCSFPTLAAMAEELGRTLRRNA